jgi:hypothetical protein
VTIHEFASLAADMREAQRTYFRSMPGTIQKQTALNDSKRLERRVDDACREVLSPSPSLFPREA